MRAVVTVMKKELRRFFTDKRMILTVLLLPGLLIYVMYSFMGEAMTGAFMVGDEYCYPIGISRESTVLTGLLSAVPSDVSVYTEPDGQYAVEAGVLDVYISIPEGFDTILTEGTEIPHIAVYFNSADTQSQSGYSLVVSLLDGLEDSLANRFDVNTDSAIRYDMADEKETSSMVLSLMMPLLLTMLLFTGSMSVAMEAIAGEKERGTIAALLITPAKRSSLALGKILALAITAFASGTVTTGFVMASIPKLMGGTVAIEANIYSIADYVMLFSVVVSTVLLYVSAISIFSALAKSIKEAQALITPLMMVVVLVGLTAMFSQTAPTEVYWYCIPLYNSVQSMLGIFAAQANGLHVLVTVLVNLAVSGVGILILARMFDSERIVFNS